MTHHFRTRIFGIYLKQVKENREITTSNRLDLETVGFWPIIPEILPDIGEEQMGIDWCDDDARNWETWIGLFAPIHARRTRSWVRWQRVLAGRSRLVGWVRPPSHESSLLALDPCLYGSLLAPLPSQSHPTHLTCLLSVVTNLSCVLFAFTPTPTKSVARPCIGACSDGVRGGASSVDTTYVYQLLFVPCRSGLGRLGLKQELWSR